MKNWIIALSISFANLSAFAGDFTIDGVSFNRALVSVQYRDYRSPDSASCEVRVSLSKKSFLGKSLLMKNGRPATCADLSVLGVAHFTGSESSTALSSLLMSLENRAWRSDNNDMEDGSPNTLACKIYIKEVRNTALNDLCYRANQAGSFSTGN